jgi:SAM-dependent MidA family methyltransferase
MSLSRFMEHALYCPVYGYYEKEGDKIGRRGDYYTSVSAGSLFGELLACQFAEWFEQGPGIEKCQESGVECHGSGHEKCRVGSGECGVENAEDGGAEEWGAATVQLVEAGAHGGQLAKDILGWMREWRGEVYGRLEYCIVEPSDRRREWQRRTLSDFLGKVRWVEEVPGVRCRAPCIIFANELLDAMPVHRLGWDAGQRAWFEWGITVEDGRFAWTRMSAPACLLVGTSPLDAVLPDGFTREVCPAAVDWWRQAASVLQCRKLVALDYGLTAEESLLPERPGGTLRAYSRHRVGTDVLLDPGEQDITAHVDFDAIQRAGEAAGLTTETFITQSQFLTKIVEKILSGAVKFGEWTSERTRQFQTLTHPEHLGRAFRVLVQARGG